jgi:iron-regulated transporter 1
MTNPGNDPTSSVVAVAVQIQSTQDATSVLPRLYLSHILSTWNGRTFEFGAVIFLAKIFPGTLFYASCYALFRSAAAASFSSWIGGLVDRNHRLHTVRHSIIWQRISVASSCLLLLAMLRQGMENTLVTLFLFTVTVGLACLEKLAFTANTVAVERDWVIVVSDSLGLEREDLNSTMRRIDLICKLVAPLCISLVDGYSTKMAIWAVFGQNALSVVFEYFAVAQVFAAVPSLAQRKTEQIDPEELVPVTPEDGQDSRRPTPTATSTRGLWASLNALVAPYRSYFANDAFLASLSLSLLYLTVLSFSSQMTTYLLATGFTPLSVSILRLVAVILELSATCATPVLMRKIGAVRTGLWSVNEQLLSIVLSVVLFSIYNPATKLAAGVLVAGVVLSRFGLWGFDLSVQYLVQEDAPASSRGSFSAVEAALQNFFELISFAVTMVFDRPEQFQIPVYISAGATTVSAACFAKFVRQKRGHLLHTSKCFTRERRAKYNVLPTIEEELLDEIPQQ